MLLIDQKPGFVLLLGALSQTRVSCFIQVWLKCMNIGF